jgi:DNA repair protein RecN (Recombination protein N)
MLLELRAENYAVIDHAIAVFGRGLNLLTGETGAGKSILVDALAMMLGERASTDLVRHGAERAVVTCVFESTPGAEAILEENGIDAEGTEIILRREIQGNGKGRVYVNNQAATVAVLRQLAPELALVHAQSETLGGFDQAQQRQLLDRYAGIGSKAVSDAWDEWRAVCSRLGELEGDERERLRQAGLWRFEAHEIESAQPKPGEDQALETERRMLANAEKLYSAAMHAYGLLYESGSSAEAALGAALKHLEELARFDPAFTDAVDQIRSARAMAGDVSGTVRDYAGKIQASPERLGEIEDRLALLDRLKRKYGADLGEVMAYGRQVQGQLEEIENRDQLLNELRDRRESAAAAYRAAARELTAKRQGAAVKLEKLVEAEVNGLAMRAKFAIEVAPHEDENAWGPHGWDTVQCRIATNAGEPLKPLHEIASGGEMSRVMLALKVSVGQKLKILSRTQQVLCVTHLPQIAAFADQHLAVVKDEEKGRTRTAVRLLGGAERTEEVARMLSGAKLTETSLRHAEQMIRASR